MLNRTMIANLRKFADGYTKGLTDSDFFEIEKMYNVQFPKSLADFLRKKILISKSAWGFVNWRDLSKENVQMIGKRINAPYKWLKTDALKHGFGQADGGNDRYIRYPGIQR